MDDKEIEEEGEEQGGNSGVREELGESKGDYFGWLTLVDNVGQLTRDKWDDIFEKNIYEFFNLLSYLKYKNNRQKEQIEKWKRSH